MKKMLLASDSKNTKCARAGFPYGEVLRETITKQGEKLIVRRYKQADNLEAIFNLHLKSMKSNPGYVYLPDTGWDKDLKDIDANYMSGRNDFVVAEINGNVVGFGALMERADLGENIVEFCKWRTDPDYFGHGVGRALLEVRYALARKHDFMTAYAETSTLQKQSMHLHEKDGWTQTKKVQSEWSKNLNAYILCYEKELKD
jgi:N-acetylglutamate synthase-like GNAT family acetyltransferase